MRAATPQHTVPWPAFLHLGAAMVIALAATTAGQAHDLLPPSFRGGPGTTFQAWEFNTPVLGAPDGECTANNPFGAPSATGVGNQWLAVFPPNPPNLQGIQCLPLGAALLFDIPNMIHPVNIKTVWVQIVFHPHNGSDVTVTVNDGGGNAAVLAGSQDLPVPGHPAWIHRTMAFCFFNGCPPDVDVTLLSLIDHVDIDQVIIDTSCADDCLPPAPPAAPGDYDGDGIPDGDDNAPGVANPNQVDCDCDGFGNVSDLWGICVPGTPPETELCGLDLNGGCDSVLPVFEPIACGDTVCGTAWADAGLRDTDWYELNLTDTDGDGLAKVRAEICTALPVVGFVLNDDCANLITLAQTEANPDLVGCLTACLPAPATYYIFVAPGTLAGGIFTSYPCGTANEYSLDVDCFEPCTGGGTCGCPWDLDDSGDVGVVDFLALLAAWGPNPGHPADFNCDGNVDVLDFLELLASWGPCP
ncbi:MAG: hypothetical protein ACYSU7_05460 [Planctomycetota bacterium]|jgi:hypothetical protein